MIGHTFNCGSGPIFSGPGDPKRPDPLAPTGSGSKTLIGLATFTPNDVYNVIGFRTFNCVIPNTKNIYLT